MIYLLLFIQQLISSSTHLVADDLSEHLHPIHVVLVRGMFTCAVFSLWFVGGAIFKQGWWKPVQRRDLILIALLGLLNIAVNQVLFIWGVKYTTPPNASLAYALTPVFVVVLSRIVDRRPLSTKKQLGVAAALLGAGIVLAERGITLQPEKMLGNIMVLCASGSWAVYTFYSSKLIERYGTVQAIALTFYSGMLLYLPLWLSIPVSDSLAVLLHPGAGTIWMQLFYLGVVTSAIGYGLWYLALTKLPSVNVAVFNNMQPVLTSVLAIIILGAMPSTPFVIGGMIAVAGVVITQKS